MKEDWKVSKTINQTGYARGKNYVGRKMEIFGPEHPEHPKISRQLKTGLEASIQSGKSG